MGVTKKYFSHPLFVYAMRDCPQLIRCRSRSYMKKGYRPTTDTPLTN